ncbi:MAG TPA: 8-amino-7-oxononanoate synthase [Microthrixaceae bacterium]|nr:8-amino-7-oxononanoate synthase [Microthrixaceae bacterium]
MAREAAEQLRAQDRWRVIRTLADTGVRSRLADGRAVVQFASNDYFGLSEHPAVIEAAIAATRRWGTGAGASRLVVGSRPIHDDLEAALADWKHAEAALLFATGYAANVGVLVALARLGAALGAPIGIVSDELNHASIIDGIRLSAAPFNIYAHADAEAARQRVVEHLDAGRRPVIVTDSVFSMDGDLAPLGDLAQLAAETSALLVIDDAHAVFAGCGADLVASAPSRGGAEVVVVGTLSKSLGSLGGFVAGPTALVDWCRNTSRSFIFSTATPPGVAAAALAALEVLQGAEGVELTAKLRRNVDVLAPAQASAVVPVVVGTAERALEWSDKLLERSMFVPAIRPPTVPEGSSRLRVAVSARHATGDLEALREALADLRRLDPTT